MARTSLPPGFRFHPTDVELIMYYLKRKLLGKKLSFEISEINIYKFSPWDLPDKSGMRSKDLEWFFLCPREKKYASGARTNRATESGYWKTTGKDRSVNYNGKVVGMIKTLVFHIGHAPQGERTDWVMHEYRFVDADLGNAGISQDAYVLCKVFQKSGPGPKNGAQYGAPFNEEEWDDDKVIAADSSPGLGLSQAAMGPTNNPNSSALTTMIASNSGCSWSLTEPGPSAAVSTESGPRLDEHCDDDIGSLLDMFTVEPVLPIRNDNNEELSNHSPGDVIEAVLSSDGNDIYGGLGDLAYCASLSGGGFYMSNIMEDSFSLNPFFQGSDPAFLELSDLEIPLEFPAEAQVGQLPPLIYTTPINITVNSGNVVYDGNSNFLGTSQDPSSLNQPPAVLEGSLWQGNDIGMLQQENGVAVTANRGHASALHHLDLASNRQAEESRNVAAQAPIRGKQQRIHYSRKLQHPLESHPVSAVDQHLAAVRGRADDNYSILGGHDSSFDVKAEVISRCGCSLCTKDALSMKQGESSSTWMSSFRVSLFYHMANCMASSSFGFLHNFFRDESISILGCQYCTHEIWTDICSKLRIATCIFCSFKDCYYGSQLFLLINVLLEF